MTGPSPEVAAAISRTAREDGGRVVALLAGHFHDLDLADESVQDALEEALRGWATTGIPDQPAAWLLTVARRKAIDRLRRSAVAYRRTMAVAANLALDGGSDDDADLGETGRPVRIDTMSLDQADVADDQLRLIFLCCHPALDPDAQVALTLRLVGGLSTGEIASAYLVPEPTLAQRLVRAKRKIRDARIPLSMPAALDQRLAAVLRVLYLIFNEGYLTHGPGDAPLRVDLAEEAIRLTGLVIDLVPDSAEAKGLLALELFHHARMASRVDADAELVLLEDQDRTRWVRSEIDTANRVLNDAVGAHRDGSDSRVLEAVGTFQLQAMIAGYHANAPTAGQTDWTAIVRVYDRLALLDDSAVVRLNRAVAVAMADGPQVGLALLEEIHGLDDYHLFHATRGEFWHRAGDDTRAAESFRRARDLARNRSEQRHLVRRLESISPS